MSRPAKMSRFVCISFLLVMAALSGLSSCASRRDRTVQLPPSANVPASGTMPETSPSPSSPNNPSARTLPPIADKAITLAGSCTQTEEDGFKEQAVLTVDKNEVRSMNWQITVGKRGSCQFDIKEFVQTQKSPHIELQAKDGSKCRLLVWQTPDRVTLAHNNCQKHCTPGIYDDAWPVMFNPKTGACASLG
jgi:hypothetical protein